MRQELYQFTDPSVLLVAVAGDLKSCRELAATFVEIAPPMFERLDQAMQVGNNQAIIQACHALRGATVLVGAAQLTELLSKIENARRRGDQACVLPAFAELIPLFGNVMQEVRHCSLHFSGIDRLSGQAVRA
jgi:HPt (histidine-containing phosphotransfer) domain-containing protein